ncbi:MAG: hypothetical protein OQK46_07025 [Gammaproteobacteria bacterium]|nr:hypothetical protein [Gammaproteobacteria bacterium]
MKNKHLILAMFITPVLAILAYFATDYMVSEKPQMAQQGEVYKLAANSNCRYQSGVCTLKNGDIEVSVRAQRIENNQLELIVNSDLEIQSALVLFVNDKENNKSKPVAMKVESENSWKIKLNQKTDENTLRLALGIGGSLYYAETSAVFIDYKTSFSQDNF